MSVFDTKGWMARIQNLPSASIIGTDGLAGGICEFRNEHLQSDWKFQHLELGKFNLNVELMD